MRKPILGLLIAVVASLAMSASAGAAPFVFTDNSTINVTDNAASATPASSINVTMPGLAAHVEVQLYGVTHTRAADLDVIVQSPTGQYYWLMSDNCGTGLFSGKDWNFSDSHPTMMGANFASCSGTNYKPSDNNVGTDDLVTAIGSTPASSFAGLSGANHTGTWHLYVADDEAAETGSIDGGWEIRIDSTTPDAFRIPGLNTAGEVGPIGKFVSGFPRTISDIDVQLNDLTHTYAGDLDFALESPAGTKVVFASDGCETSVVKNMNWIFDDEAATPYPSSEVAECFNTVQRFSPFNHPIPETEFGSVLTGGPFPSNLSAFDGQLANGAWKFYVNDGAGGDFGFINGYELAITMRGAKTQTPSNPTFKFKKLGKRFIRATGRVTLSGEALTAGECAKSVKSTFQVKSVRRKGKKKITSYKKVVAVNSSMTEKAGKCGFDITVKLPKKYAGQRLRLVTNYLGGQYIAPFTRTSTEKIKKLKF